MAGPLDSARGGLVEGFRSHMSCDGFQGCRKDWTRVGWLGMGVGSFLGAGSCEKPNVVVNFGNLNLGGVDC